jgi:Eukaryotic DNA topoisomerase I, catalytic core
MGSPIVCCDAIEQRPKGMRPCWRPDVTCVPRTHQTVRSGVSSGPRASFTHCAARKPSNVSRTSRCQPKARPACIAKLSAFALIKAAIPWGTRRPLHDGPLPGLARAIADAAAPTTAINRKTPATTENGAKLDRRPDVSRDAPKIIRACQELPRQELLQYIDEEGNCQDVTSSHVNDYLKEITGRDVTAKDFRTWAGTVLAAMALNEFKSFDWYSSAKRNLRSAIEKVSARLGNTPTICRKCYLHPEVLNSYMDGNLVLELKSRAESELRGAIGSLKPEEPPCWRCCEAGLQRSSSGPHVHPNGHRRAHGWPREPPDLQRDPDFWAAY